MKAEYVLKINSLDGKDTLLKVLSESGYAAYAELVVDSDDIENIHWLVSIFGKLDYQYSFVYDNSPISPKEGFEYAKV
jgi:hypothetical protein